MGITANGYETTPVEDIKASVEQLFKTALGEDLSLDAETPQGNMIAAITDLLHQIDMQRQNDFYARDIYKAEGLQLDILGREFDIPRKDSIPTQILITLKGAVNYTVPKGTKAAIVSNSSQVFEFTADTLINAAEQQVTLVASDGATYSNLLPGMQLQCQEYIPQVYDMDIVSIVYGTPAESDYSYRIRLLEAQQANVDEVKHLTLALQNIPNVLSAYVEPNNTLNTSPSGIPPHAVEIVVLGGEESAIAQAIMGYIFATPTYDDPILGEAITGLDYNGNSQTFYITRPASKTVNIEVTYQDKPGMSLTPDDKAAISARLTELISGTYMNKTLYRSDILNLLTEGYVNKYAIETVDILVGDNDMEVSYTCTSREYLSVDTIEFTEAL